MNPLALLGAVSIRSWIEIACALALAIALVGVKVQTSRLESCKASYAAFKSETERLGKEAQVKTKAVIVKQNGATNAVRADLNTALSRMRDEHARSGAVSSPPERTEGADASPVQLRLSCAALRDGATDDALRLYFFQEWVRQQGLPVE